jgi:hypothetical protein
MWEKHQEDKAQASGCQSYVMNVAGIYDVNHTHPKLVSLETK